MIFADKVIRLRKKHGWSQEELAEKMGTSRQAISKWEGAQSVPDIGKILQLAQLFSVTTDYLLKDEIEDEEYSDGDTDLSVKKVTMAQATEYLLERKSASVRIAIATFLCILSPLPLILLGALSENPANGISEDFAGAIGLASLFFLVAAAVVIFVMTGFKNSPYEFLDQEPFVNEYGVKGLVQEKQKAYSNTYALFNVIGTCVCILSPIPLFISAFLDNEMLSVIMLAVMFVIAGIGVVFFILAGVRMSSMRRLLKEGEFSPAEKKSNRVIEAVSTAYWLITVAIYLGICFFTGDWKSPWIVWPVAGVLYAAVITLCNLFVTKH